MGIGIGMLLGEMCKRYDEFEYKKVWDEGDEERLLHEAENVCGEAEVSGHDGRWVNQLRMRHLSLNHRIKKCEEQLNGDVLVMIVKEAVGWLKAQSLQTYRKIGGVFTVVDELTAHQMQKIQKAIEYSGFGRLLLRDVEIRADFFRWALLENCPVEPYIEYYGTCQELLKLNILHKRVGYQKETPLRIIEKTKEGRGSYKRLTLLFEEACGGWKARSVHSLEKEINMRGLTLTKRAIYTHFRNKRETPGDVEMLDGVIRNWNYFYGRKNSKQNSYVDFELENEDWFRCLPTFNTLTELEMRAKYNVEESVRPDQWVMCICANRESPTMDIARTHGFIVFLIPDGNGCYKELPFTFLAQQFVSGYPTGSKLDIMSQIWRLGKTERGLWAYPDETMYYLRQFGAFPIVIDAPMGLRHMEALRGSFTNAREGYQHFQISYMNCSGTIQEHAKRVHGDAVVPSIFDADILESTPKEPLGKVFSTLRGQMNFVVYFIIWMLGVFFFLTPLRMMIIKKEGRYDLACMFRTPIFSARRIYHAAKIFEFLFKRNIGAIWYGKSPREITAYAQSS